MIKSMTGYGKAICELNDKTISIEIKSLNSKQTDIYTRIPAFFREKEVEIRTLISNLTRRGKIECTLTVDYHEVNQAAKINKTVVKEYLMQLKDIQNELEIGSNEPLLTTILRLPESLKTEKEELSEAEWNQAKKTLVVSLEQLDDFRKQEGRTLEKDMEYRVGLIEDLLGKVDNYEKPRIEKIREKLKSNLKDLLLVPQD